MAYNNSPYDSQYDSPTPPHRGGFSSFSSTAAAYAAAQQRPATRAHVRMGSTGDFYCSPHSTPRSSQGAFSPSPRYDSAGRYATANVNVSYSRSPRKYSFSGSSSHRVPRERRSSFSYYRPPDSQGESDEDEYIKVDGVTYVLPPRSRTKTYVKREYISVNDGGHGTDRHYYSQGARGFGVMSPGIPTTLDQDLPTPSRSRRNSTSIPQRPQTTRPPSSHGRKKPAPPRRKATEADAKKHKIPAGYSLKNWDPTEEPILLLGSVFDSNSLGKWIYDWTVYHHGPATPIADMAGEMWLLLIQLAGKIKRAEEVQPEIRAKENKEMIEEFIDAGDRLTDKFRALLKTCEQPMLRAAQKTNSHLGKDAGVEFVMTLFGRERELDRTERFMQQVRLWNLRFDTNCADLLRNPTI